MSKQEIASFVSDAVHSVKKTIRTEIDPQTEIATLELDSLHEVELLMLIEEKLKVIIDGADFNRCKTVADFIDLILSQKN